MKGEQRNDSSARKAQRGLSLRERMLASFGLVFRKTCSVCGNTLVRGECFVCSGCLKGMPLNEGAEQESDEEMASDLGVEQVFWLFGYDPGSDYHRLIHGIKYRSKRELAVWLGRMLGDKIGDAAGIDCVVPVPLHPEREKKRGFNQSLLIGTGIAEILRVEVVPDALYRVVNTRSQTGLSREERTDNVSDAFILKNDERLRGRHVLIVDDVLTSGATVGACLSVLRKVADARYSVATLGKAFKI